MFVFEFIVFCCCFVAFVLRCFVLYMCCVCFCLCFVSVVLSLFLVTACFVLFWGVYWCVLVCVGLWECSFFVVFVLHVNAC